MGEIDGIDCSVAPAGGAQSRLLMSAVSIAFCIRYAPEYQPRVGWTLAISPDWLRSQSPGARLSTRILPLI